MAISPLVDTWLTLGQDVPQVSFRDWARSVQSNVDAQNQNLLINGDFQINQRNFAGGALAPGVYGFDRWRGYGPGASAFSRSGYVVTLTGRIGQAVEPTVMAGVASLASTAITVSIENPSGNIVVIVGSASGTLTAGSGWRSITLTTAVGDTGNIIIALDTTVSTTFSRVKAEVGSIATVYVARAAALELVLCQRYYQNGYPNGVTPADGVSFSQSYYAFASADADNRLYSAPVYFSVTMRTTPTVTTYRSNVAATTNGRWQYFSGSWTAGTSTFPGTLNEKGFRMVVDGTGLTAGTTYLLIGGWEASAEL